MPHNRSLYLAFGMFCVLDATVVIGAPSDSLVTTQIEPIIVTAPRVVSPLVDVPAAISRVGASDIHDGRPGVAFDEALGRVPGLFAQNRYNFAQDLRLSIRGFGSRSAFGIRGIRILVDGIPETMPDGQSQVDAIDAGVAERIEVMRGPVSSLYGNASGGVISITTTDPPERAFASLAATGGGNGLDRRQFRTGGRAGALRHFFSYTYFANDGYRRQSATTMSRLLTAKIAWDLSDRSSLTAILTSADSPKAQDPGALTRDEIAVDRTQVAPLNRRFDTGESVEQHRVSLAWNHSGREGEAALTTYYGRRDFTGRVPFRVVTFDRDFGGGEARFERRGAAGGVRNRLLAGVDVQYQKDARDNFANIAGVAGATLLSQDETVWSVGPYLQNEATVFDRFTALCGLRYDRVGFDVADRFLADGDDGGKRTFDQVTGRVGLDVVTTGSMHVYGNVSQGFETPTTTELRSPDLGLSSDVDAQHSVNYEVGVKGGHRNVSYQASVFAIALRDELLPFEDSTGTVFFRNAGKSRRNGAEVSVDLEPVPGLRVSFAYTWLDAWFTEFTKVESGGAMNLSKKKLPGLPPHQFFGELFYKHRGFFGGIDASWARAFFVDDENLHFNDSYAVVNLRLGYDGIVNSVTLSPFIGVQNLTNELYNANTRINASGGRYYEPAPERTVYAGITAGYER